MVNSLKTNKKLYFSLFKAVVPGVLFLIVLFSMFFVSNNDKVITSLTKVFYGDNEVELDNWEISTVFYDSTVNEGRTPLTEINWDASDGGYGEQAARIITVQINYKNTNTVTDYESNELKINVDNLGYQLLYRYDSKTPLGAYPIVVGANDNTHEGYDWNFDNYNTADSLVDIDHFVFSNVNKIEANTNLEGSIRILYYLIPNKDSPYHFDSQGDLNPLNECTKELSRNVVAKLNNELVSNSISLNYQRLYNHPWQKRQFSITKNANHIDSLDGLPSGEYYWVRYDFEISGDTTNSYPYYGAKSHYLLENLPTDCVVLDSNMNVLNSDNGLYSIPQPLWYSNEHGHNRIFVGYPKNKYKEELNNNIINNKVELYSLYYGNDDYELTSESEISLNILDYDFEYSGDLFGISKGKYIPEWWNNRIHYKQSLTGEYVTLGTNGKQEWYLLGYAKYTGNPFDFKIGDDLLFITRDDGTIGKLEDNEYYFSSIKFPTTILNGNSVAIEKNKYDCELWIRTANQSNYVKYEEFKNDGKTWNFVKDDKVVGFYFVIKNVKESIIINSNKNSFTATTVINDALNIPDSGEFYNFDYFEVFNNNNIINAGNETSYDSFMKELNIDDYDFNNYGHYLMRGYNNEPYIFYQNPPLQNSIAASKSMSPFTQNVEKEKFFGSAKLEFHFWQHESPGQGYGNGVSADTFLHFSGDTLNYNEGVTGFEYFDLLPEGMELNSTKEEILSSLNIDTYPIVCDINKNIISLSSMKSLIANNTTITIDKNWNNTNRTLILISVDLVDNPIYMLSFSFSSYSSKLHIEYSYDYSVSYDSYVEYGNKWDNDYYHFFIGNQFNGRSHIIDTNDIDKDGDVNEQYVVAKSSSTISSVISTNQDVQVSAHSGDNYYETGTVKVPNDLTYDYKLRARTGANDVTNLVVYDSLEKYAKDPNMANILASGGRGSWQGEFLGIDTSYAESKGYTIRTYYSEDDQPGSIHSDNSWQLYTDSVDKSKVKSLAFEYLDSSGNPAVIPANSLTYVLIKMKSPADPDIKTFAYNGCWTEWNAIDPITGQTVDFITGINSNIVKVALPNSVEPVDMDFTINKYWNDNNNQDFRPDTINIQVVPNGDVTKAINVPLGSTNIDPNNPLHWSTSISVPKYDDDGEEIDYTLREGEIILENGYKYTPIIEGNTVTNALMKEIELKKIWKDNNNAYLTRPTNVVYMVEQNGNDYKVVTFTGDYSTNEWTKKITVPVFDSNNNEYTYTVSEIVMDGYTPSCSGLVCTNTLTGNKNIRITKEWNDKNNEYNTRPNTLYIELRQNGNAYILAPVTGNGNTWSSDNIEVPIYDENGVKYNYTISEDNIDEYGLVEYDQNNYKVTNTLKKKINLVIKKIWVDDNNSNNTRPNELNITLLRDGDNYQTVTLTGDTNEWTTSIEVDKYDDDLHKYKYSIKEINDSISDLYSNVTYSEDELTVTNTLSQNTSLTISKKWIDQDNIYMTRPDSVKVNLLQNGNVYREVTISKDKNWKEEVSDIPVFDSNQNRYTYTIEESISTPKYDKVTYDQSNFEITNELTEIPTVSLYFTVVNGYIDPVTGEMKYDDFGLNEILKQYNKTLEDEYIFTFELQNLDSGKLYDGKLSTQGILEFKDIPYGEYKAVEGEDNLFAFVDMLSIEEVNGVSFRREGNEGYISIRPTGENIVFGAKIVNRINPPIDNPNTGVIIEILILLVLLLPITYSLYLLNKTIKSQ